MRSDVPAYLAVAIDRALAKRPTDRWADAAEFRDALDGANPAPIGADHTAAARSSRVEAVPDLQPERSPAPVPAPFPAPPPGLGRGELKQWYRAQRRLALTQQLGVARGGLVVNDRLYTAKSYDDRPLEERVLSFRRSVMAWLGWSAVLFGINVSMHSGGPWFLIPSAAMFIGVMRRGGSIWSDGVGPIDAFKKGIRAKLRAERGDAAASPEAGVSNQAPAQPKLSNEELAEQLAPRDVLAGAHGDAVRRASADRALMHDISAALRPVEREMIPDIGPTVDALAQRVGALATTLHRLDSDVSGTNLGSLDKRLAALETEPDTPDRERRLSLLRRQRASLRDLLERRQSLANQLESAGLMLQNLKLDLLKLRSSGIGSAIEDVTTATQEARALSREIGHVVQAAEELKRL